MKQLLMKGCGLALCGALFAVQAMAAREEAQKSPKHWNGEAGLGYVATTGNTETTTFAAKLDATHEKENWRNNIAANTLYTKNAQTKTAEKYFISVQSNYRYSPRMFFFGRASYEDDRFSGFEYQGTLTAGLGYRFLVDRPDMALDTEAGAGIKAYREEGRDQESEAIGRLAGKYVWDFREKSKFTQEVSADFGDSFDVYKSVTSLTAQLVGNFAINLGYTVKYTTAVPAGKEKKDTETTINMVYVF